MSYSKTAPFVLAAALMAVVHASSFAQRNNPFSANPDVQAGIASAKRAEPQQIDFRRPVKAGSSAASVEKGADPTQIYKIAPGDTLQIVLTNAPNASGCYSVRSDGTIDFPLAGDNPRVQGMTTVEIESMLSSRVKLYRDARLTVKVTEFRSHKINVSGLVERNGERYLPRDAMPLYTVKADVGVMALATLVLVTRASGSTEIYRLREQRTDDVLVAAGDTIEFKN